MVFRLVLHSSSSVEPDGTQFGAQLSQRCPTLDLLNFGELRKREVRRRRLPRTPVNRGDSTQTLSCLWWKGLEPAASNRATGRRKEEATNAAVHDAVRLHH